MLARCLVLFWKLSRCFLPCTACATRSSRLYREPAPPSIPMCKGPRSGPWGRWCACVGRPKSEVAHPHKDDTEDVQQVPPPSWGLSPTASLLCLLLLPHVLALPTSEVLHVIFADVVRGPSNRLKGSCLHWPIDGRWPRRAIKHELSLPRLSQYSQCKEQPFRASFSLFCSIKLSIVGIYLRHIHQPHTHTAYAPLWPARHSTCHSP